MITLVKEPEKYTPANNQIIYQFTSDEAAIVYFNIKIKEVASNETISNLKIYPTPAYQNGAFVNVSSILKNVVKTSIKKNDTIVESVNGDICNYALEVTERLLVSGNIIDGDSLTFNNSYVFNAGLPHISFDAYDYNKLVNTSLHTGKFLTNKPDKSSIKFWSTEHLYFLNDANAVNNVKISTSFNTGNTVYTFPITPATTAGRINVSPRSLTANNIEVEGMQSMQVQLYNEDEPVSELKTFVASRFNCSAEPVNLIWINELGGLDSYTFQNPRETLSVDRSTIKVNPYQINSSGYYSNSNDNLYKSDNQIYNVTDKSNYSVVSDWLTNYEYAWLATIIKSKQAYVELTDGKLLPISITDTSYRIENSKYSSTPLSLTVNYTTESGLNIGWNESQIFNDRIGQIGFNYPSGILIQTTGFEYVVGNDGELII